LNIYTPPGAAADAAANADKAKAVMLYRRSGSNPVGHTPVLSGVL
jgi:hypothetical protein